MKKFISKNWKNILLIIGAIFLVIDLFFIITTPATVSEDFLKYGPNIESDIFDATETITGEVNDNINESISQENNADKESGEDTGLIDKVSESTGMSPNLAQGLIIFSIALVGLLILSGIMDGSSASKGGKKK